MSEAIQDIYEDTNLQADGIGQPGNKMKVYRHSTGRARRFKRKRFSS